MTTERELAEALMDKERFIRLDAHIGLTGAFKSAEVGGMLLQGGWGLRAGGWAGAFKSAEVWGGGSLPHRPCWYRLAALGSLQGLLGAGG